MRNDEEGSFEGKLLQINLEGFYPFNLPHKGMMLLDPRTA